MKKTSIIITEADHVKLRRLIQGEFSPREQADVEALEQELARAEIVPPDDVPPDVITMNSCAELLDLATGETMEFTVVFPHDVEVAEGKISVLAPVGLAMLGYRVGDVFERRTPDGIRRMKVTNVTYQPEAALAAAN